MNSAHFHLMVNHLPVFAALFSAGLVAAGVAFRKKPIVDAGLVLAIVAAIGAVAATQTGERAEEMVEGLPAVTEATIHEHEEAAEVAMFALVALGGLAMVALAIPARMATAKTAATWGALTLAFVAFGLVGRAANLGGLIRHPEIVSEVPGGAPMDAEYEHGEDVEH